MMKLPSLTGSLRMGAVIGSPIRHSLSPAIMRRWADETGADMVYGALEIPANRLEPALRGLSAAGVRALNVTIPHKEAVLQYCTTLSDNARRAGAVNFLIQKGDGWHGENTDITGIIETLGEKLARAHHGVILGNGGAARAAMLAMELLGFSRITIIARRPENAQAVAGLASSQTRVVTKGWQEMDRLEEKPDCVFNATPIGMAGTPSIIWPETLFAGRPVVYDSVYAASGTELIARARDKVCVTLDGFDMLVAQARPCFARLSGMEPPQDWELAQTLRQHVRGTQ
jgi:shikimate dehydrogenase